jgi:hypothetical protein
MSPPDHHLQKSVRSLSLVQLANEQPEASGEFSALTLRALELRIQGHYAAHPIEAALLHHRASAEVSGEESDGGVRFREAESHYRAGAQGLRLSEIPQLPGNLRQLSRLAAVDRAGRKTLREWAAASGFLYDDDLFRRNWEEQGRRGGVEHHVFHHQETGRWFKRLYHGVHQSTLGDYISRMRLHAVLFPETAYRLEGFTINAKSKELAPVVSQPHIEVDTDRPLVSKAETDDLMAGMGFAPVQLMHEGQQDDGYFAYLHPISGILAHDLHDENVVRMPGTNELAVIDPCISLVRRGTWAAIKLAEIGYPPPDDDLTPS